MDYMGSVKYLISIDPHSGYWQCCIADKDIPKIVFFTRYGLYEWVARPMGLNTPLAILMHTMNIFFLKILDYDMALFLYDILICSCMMKQHLTLLENVLAC